MIFLIKRGEYARNLETLFLGHPAVVTKLPTNKKIEIPALYRLSTPTQHDCLPWLPINSFFFYLMQRGGGSKRKLLFALINYKDGEIELYLVPFFQFRWSK